MKEYEFFKMIGSTIRYVIRSLDGLDVAGPGGYQIWS